MTVVNDRLRPRRPLYTLYATMLISVTGDVMAALAIPWFVLQTTGSAVQTGITAFFSIVPIIIGMVFGSTLVDRVGYKRVSIIADVASGATTLLIPLLYLTIGLEFWQLLALVFLGNLLDAPGRAARQAMLPELAQAAKTDLERASGLLNAVSRATAMIGAPIAGVLIASSIGPVGVLVINAATFFLSALLIGVFIPTQLIEKKREGTKTSYWEDLRAGFRFVATDSLILTFIITIMITNMIDFAWSSVTLPIYTRTRFGEDLGSVYQGLLLGTSSAAALVGTLLYSAFGKRLFARGFTRRGIYTFAFLQVGLRFFIYALFSPLQVLVITVAIGSFLASPIDPIIFAVLYERIPTSMRARVFGVLSASVQVVMPLGGLLAGYLVEGVGLQTTLLLYGVIYFVPTVYLLFSPAIRQMDRAPDGEDIKLAEITAS